MYGLSATRVTDAATSALAERSRPEAPVASAVAIEKPSPPNAVTITLASPGPETPISPAVEHPISGAPPDRSLIVRISSSRS